jgi:type II secretory pathway component PulK
MTRLRISHKSRRGFAIITALVLMVLIAVCLLILADVFMGDMRATRQIHRRAQMQELLTAGTIDVLAHARRWGRQVSPVRWRMPLPQLPVADAAVRVRVESSAQDRVRVKVNVLLGRVQRRQTVTLRRKDRRWIVTAVSPPSREPLPKRL